SDAGLAAAAKPPLPLSAAEAAVKSEPRDTEHPSGAAGGAASSVDAADGTASPEQSPPRPMAVAAALRPQQVTAARRPAATASLPAKGQGLGGRMAATGKGSAAPGAARTTLATGMEGDEGKPHASSAARLSGVSASGTAASTAGASAPSSAQLPGSGLGGGLGNNSLPQLPQALAPRMNLGRPPTVVTAKLRAAPSAQLPARAVLAAAAASVVQPSAGAAIDGAAAAAASPESPMGEADAAGQGGSGGVGDAGNHRRGGTAPPSNVDAIDGPASREAATFSRPGSVQDLRETSLGAVQTVGSTAVDVAGSRQAAACAVRYCVGTGLSGVCAVSVRTSPGPATADATAVPPAARYLLA
ncbi:hypothetical protein Vafri_14854, partial [Volvox africanus]